MWTWDGGCKRKELLHLERLSEYQGLLEDTIFKNAWFHGVLYFERLRALTLHVKERRCLDLREVTRVGGDVRS